METRYLFRYRMGNIMIGLIIFIIVLIMLYALIETIEWVTS